MNRLTLYLIAAAIVLGVIGTLLFETHQVRQSLKESQQHEATLGSQLDQANRDLSGRDLLLAKYRQQSNRNAELTIEQHQTIADITTRLQGQTLQLQHLERENADIKRWADARLPDPVIRLHQRPAISGAAAYRKWLSDRDAMPVTSQ